MVDVTDATFMQDVIEKSKDVPVVVDLWAPWCGPCRQLGPIIEDVVASHDGDVVLAKVNVDENPQVSQAFRVQGIPAVFGLRNGKVIDSFVGAQGKDAVSAFVQGLLPTAEEGEVARLLALGDIPSLRLARELDWRRRSSTTTGPTRPSSCSRASRSRPPAARSRPGPAPVASPTTRTASMPVSTTCSSGPAATTRPARS